SGFALREQGHWRVRVRRERGLVEIAVPARGPGAVEERLADGTARLRPGGTGRLPLSECPAGQGRSPVGGLVTGGHLWNVMYPLPSRSEPRLVYLCTSARLPDGFSRWMVSLSLFQMKLQLFR